MPKISTRVTFDRSKAVALIKAASDDALTIMGNQALKDINQYVPKDQGTLENSGIISSDLKAKDGKIRLRWNTPYARYLWNGKVMHGNAGNRTYGPDKITFTSALAREEWAKHARKVHGEEWRKVYQAALRRFLKR